MPSWSYSFRETIYFRFISRNLDDNVRLFLLLSLFPPLSVISFDWRLMFSSIGLVFLLLHFQWKVHSCTMNNISKLISIFFYIHVWIQCCCLSWDVWFNSHSIRDRVASYTIFQALRSVLASVCSYRKWKRMIMLYKQ